MVLQEGVQKRKDVLALHLALRWERSGYGLQDSPHSLGRLFNGVVRIYLFPCPWLLFPRYGVTHGHNIKIHFNHSHVLTPSVL